MEESVVEVNDTDSEFDSVSEGQEEEGAWRWWPFLAMEVEREEDEELEALCFFTQRCGRGAKEEEAWIIYPWNSEFLQGIGGSTLLG